MNRLLRIGRRPETGDDGGSPAAAAAVVAATVASIIVLHRAGAGTLAAPPVAGLDGIGAWIDDRDPTVVAFMIIRLTALAAAYHLLLAAALGLLGRALRSRHLVAIAVTCTLPPLRGALHRVVGAGLTASIVLSAPTGVTGPIAATSAAASAGPSSAGTATLIRIGDEGAEHADAHEDPGHRGEGGEGVDGAGTEHAAEVRLPPTTETIRPTEPDPVDSEPVDSESEPSDPIDGHGVPAEQSAGTTATIRRMGPSEHGSSGSTTSGAAATLPSVPSSDPAEDPEPDPAPGDGAASEVGPTAAAGSRHVVAVGDHLWSIAASTVSNDLGRDATDEEVAPYWRSVIVANPQISDPDLIHPGDVVVLPGR